jgi:ATP-binding cassette subfamily F protein 3
MLARLSALQVEFEHGGGYTHERRIQTVLTGLGFGPGDWPRPLGQFSGGQRTRAALARLLLEDPEVLLLDEPTNHLDLDAVEWLEGFLAGFRGTLLVVSHDRYFLDKLSRRVWELAGGELAAYRGNYSHYLRQREERRAERLARWEAQQERVERTMEFVRRYGAGQRSKEARGRLTHLRRFLEEEAVEKPRQDARIHLEIRDAGWGGDLLFRAKNLAIGYPPAGPLLRVEELELCRGQRVALLGPNGAGKTTLVRTLLGEVPPLAGEVRRSPSAQVGYLSQAQAGLDPEARVVDAVRAARPALKEEQVRSYLGGFLFSEDRVFKKVGDLSGGERSRVALARLALAGANVLLLDEPTNHLDIPSQEVLQDVLQDFPGTVLFVTHDRYLVDALATHLWIIGDGTLRTMVGNWSDYLRWRSAARAGGSGEAPAAAEARQAAKDARRDRQRLSRLQSRHKAIEKEIHELEARLHSLTGDISRASEAGKGEQVRRLGEDYRAADARLKLLWDEWIAVGGELEAAGQ